MKSYFWLPLVKYLQNPVDDILEFQPYRKATQAVRDPSFQ